MHKDHISYLHFMTKARIDKSINTLLGLIEGITVDSKINEREIKFLHDWISEHNEVRNKHPFNELVPVVKNALEDGILTHEEYQDILFLCQNLISQEYYSGVTIDIQRLHAILGGIIADNIITEEELKGLSEWLMDHDYLRGCYPYDEVDTIITEVMADKKIDPDEHTQLTQFFSEFIQIYDDKVLKRPIIQEGKQITGLCAMCPEIRFKDSWFCFTGASQKYTRKEFASLVNQLGGNFTNSIRKDLDYLIIGAEGNPCWMFACYGRKVNLAINLRKQGHKLLIVHENDFHDAVSDMT